ncbi:MAG: RNA 2',3'-cyclic phosphodiesterase [Candidatus Micrarchaeota archaeon]
MKLFFAIEMPEEVNYKLRETLIELKKADLSASISKYHQLHLTLVFLGEKTQEEVEKIVEEARAVKMGKFPLSIESAGFFPSEEYVRVFWAGAIDENGELKLLHSKLCKALGVAPEKEFMGHVTLARIKARRNLNKLIEIKKKIENGGFGEFEVEEFVLMKSEIGTNGTEYSKVESFKLS